MSKFKVIPYGKWWRHLLRGNLRLAYHAIFGWKREGACGSPLILDNLGLNIEPEKDIKKMTKVPLMLWENVTVNDGTGGFIVPPRFAPTVRAFFEDDQKGCQTNDR